MCENPELGLETSEANKKLDTLDQRVQETGENLTVMAKKVNEQTQKSANEVMGMMRASYMMISGLTQAFGGTMGIFGSLFSVAIQSIMTYKAVAAAMALIPGAQIQAGLMFMNLITAITSLAGAISGQEELSRRFSGLNMTIQGFGGLLDAMPFG